MRGNRRWIEGEGVNNIFSVLSSELSIAMGEGSLLSSVTKNIYKAMSLFCVKCEGCDDSEASQVIGQPTTAQLLNVGRWDCEHAGCG